MGDNSVTIKNTLLELQKPEKEDSNFDKAFLSLLLHCSANLWVCDWAQFHSTDQSLQCLHWTSTLHCWPWQPAHYENLCQPRDNQLQILPSFPWHFLGVAASQIQVIKNNDNPRSPNNLVNDCGKINALNYKKSKRDWKIQDQRVAKEADMLATKKGMTNRVHTFLQCAKGLFSKDFLLVQSWLSPTALGQFVSRLIRPRSIRRDQRKNERMNISIQKWISQFKSIEKDN